jgi:hypothetical protein
MNNQALARRLFKDAANVKERYRLFYAQGINGWVAYHNGNRILDTQAMRWGATNPGVLIDEIKRIRKW